LFEAIRNILDAMPRHVNDTVPRVPNPVDPAEDFADKWARDPRLEKNFWGWHAQAKSDIAAIAGFQDQELLREHTRACFDINVDASFLGDMIGPTWHPDVRVVTPSPAIIRSTPRPWGLNV
jgi:hypothetical protein